MSRSRSKSTRSKSKKTKSVGKRISTSSKCVSPSVKRCKSKTSGKILQNVYNQSRCPNGYVGYCEEGLEDEYEEPTLTTDNGVGEFYFTETSKIRAEDNEIVQLFENSLRTNGKMEFKILDNGAEPFKVVLFKDGDKFNVTVSDNTDQPVNPGDDIYPRKDKYHGFSKTIEDIDEIWVGCGADQNVYDMSNLYYMGNTALIVKGKVCTSLASSISRFELAPNEHVTRYVSTVGNSAVPYGWIETNKGYYALSSFNCDTGFLNKSEVDESKIKKFAMNCWMKGVYPFKKIQKIPKLKLLIPRA